MNSGTEQRQEAPDDLAEGPRRERHESKRTLAVACAIWLVYLVAALNVVPLSWPVFIRGGLIGGLGSSIVVSLVYWVLIGPRRALQCFNDTAAMALLLIGLIVLIEPPEFLS
jgi:hypothetical protein